MPLLALFTFHYFLLFSTTSTPTIDSPTIFFPPATVTISSNQSSTRQIFESNANNILLEGQLSNISENKKVPTRRDSSEGWRTQGMLGCQGAPGGDSQESSEEPGTRIVAWPGGRRQEFPVLYNYIKARHDFSIDTYDMVMIMTVVCGFD